MPPVHNLLIACIVGSLAASGWSDDWPTYRHDNARSGQSAETLALPLSIAWQKQLPRPAPAWPPPAKQDFWHRQTDLPARIVFDRAHPIVVSQGHLVTASAADDCVRCLDAASGTVRWEFPTEGPVRLAPTLHEQHALFGADDGFVYSVRLADGQLRWRLRPPQIGPRRVPGNGRIISDRPVRSGVLVRQDGTGYFVGGIFPAHEAYFFSMDVRQGRVIDSAPLEQSVQGYLRWQDGQVFATTGRDRQGATLPSGKPSGSPVDPYTRLTVSDAQHVFVGGKDELWAATKDGQRIWQASVQGRVYDLAIADGRLFASTDRGIVYAFAPENAAPRVPTQDASAPQADNGPVPSARRFALWVDPQDEQLPHIGTSHDEQVVVVVSNQERAKRVRRLLSDRDRFVAVHIHPDLNELPYAKRIFHRIYGGAQAHIAAFLRPDDGIAHSTSGEVHAGPVPEGAWTHGYGTPGNAAASSTELGSSLGLQWFGGPGPRPMMDRHLRTMPPLAAFGALIIPGRDLVLAVDAFTGLEQWRHPIPGSSRIGVLKDCGWMAMDAKQLFVAVQDQCHRLPWRQEQPKLLPPRMVPFAEREWGYVARIGPWLLGSSTLPGGSRKTVNREAILEGAYSDHRPIVCSDAVFAYRDGVEAPAWWRNRKTWILNPTLGANDKQLFFVEQDNTNVTVSKEGRAPLRELLASPARLVAIDLETGQPQWQTELPVIPEAQNLFLVCNEDYVALVCSRNQSTVHYDALVYRADDGNLTWSATQDNRRKLGGDHGEQDKHPVLVGQTLVVEPYAYDLRDGKRIEQINLRKRGYGCGTLSGCRDALFFRSGSPARYSLTDFKIAPVTRVTRPGCWINMVPACGMLLIPEGSSGCTCDYAIQTSLALAPE